MKEKIVLQDAREEGIGHGIEQVKQVEESMLAKSN